MAIFSSDSFTAFVFQKHRVWLLLAVAILLSELIIYKRYYPHLIFNYDASHYIDAAADKRSIYFWPIGYSIILRLIHTCSRSEWTLFIFQFSLLQGSLLYLYFTLKYLMKPGLWISILVLLLFVVNPIAIMISNYALSDSIFIALTICWFTATVWYIFCPRPISIYWMVSLLFVLFAIRYYAILYPVYTVIIVLFSKVSWRQKLMGLGFGCLLFTGFIWYTSIQYKKMLGYSSFSPFSGWLLAENALIMYRNLHDFSKDVPDTSLMPLHRFVTAQLQDIQRSNWMLDSPLYYYYMWMNRGPLRRYMALQYKNDTVTDKFEKFCSMGRDYERYAKFLIKRHPTAYVRYYISQNIEWYVDPVTELEVQMEGGRYFVSSKERRWFGYESGVLTYRPNNIFITGPYFIILNIANLLFLFGVAGYYFCNCQKNQTGAVNRVILLSALFWVGNFLFVVTSAPVMLRYEISTMFINIAFGLILLEYIRRS